MKEFWNNRYAANEFAYGEEPNTFFAANIAPLQAGKILMKVCIIMARVQSFDLWGGNCHYNRIKYPILKSILLFSDRLNRSESLKPL